MRSLLLYVPLVLLVSSLGCGPPQSEQRGHAETANESLSVGDESLQLANIALYSARYDSARTHYLNALDLFEASRDWPSFVKARIGIGQTYRHSGQYELAETELTEAVTAGTQLLGLHHETVAAGMSELGRIYVRLGRFDEAKEQLESALEMQKESVGEINLPVGMTYQALGLLYHFQGLYDLALDYYEKSYSIIASAEGAQSFESTIPLNNIANIKFRKGDYRGAASMHTDILKIRKLHLRKDHPSIAGSYGNLGNTYHNMGRFELALSYHRRAANIWQNIFGNEHPELAASYNNIGNALNAMTRYSEAITYLELAIVQKRKFLGETHTSVANSLQTIGESYNRLGNIRDAKRSLLSAKSIWEQSKFSLEHRYWGLLRELAGVYRQEGNDSKALKLLEYTREITEVYPHPFTALIINDLAEMERDSGNPRAQIQKAHEAILANIPSFTNPDFKVNPTIRGVLDDKELLRSLEIKADGWLTISKNNSDEVESLELALSSLERGAGLIEKMRRDYQSQGSKETLVGEAADLYANALRTSMKLLRLTGQDRYKQIAFHYSERRKTGLLLDLIIDSEARSFAGISDSLLTSERETRTEIAFYERQLAELSGPARRDSSRESSIEGKLFEAQRGYEQTIALFETKYPEYYALKHDVRTAPIADIRSEVLGDSTALLEYVLESDTLFIFAITNDTLASVGVSLPDNFSQLVDSLRWSISHRFAPAYLTHAFQLHQLLIAPVSSVIGTRDLIIVPEGIINFIPFEALLTRDVKPDGIFARYSTLPYVLVYRAVSYAYSATLLYQTRLRRRTNPTRDFFGIAPVFSKDIKLDRAAKEFLSYNGKDTTRTGQLVSYLPGTKAEVKAIKSLFERSKGLIGRYFDNGSKVLLGLDALESSLSENEISEYRYLHFATHSFANESDPKLSGMLLLPSGGTSGTDGILHTGEVYGLKLNADLVVLSACETGVGKMTTGEGIVGFSRGFLYAGARNLIVSLWPSDDAGTKYLMMEFYAYLLKGQSIRDALRSAKLALIRQGGMIAKPYFWSPFIQVGA